MVLAAFVWGHLWCQRHIFFRVDNSSVVSILNSRTSQDVNNVFNVKACNKNIPDNRIVGKIGQGMYWQGSDGDRTYRPDSGMRGLSTWHHAEGVPHACTARQTSTLG